MSYSLSILGILSINFSTCSNRVTKRFELIVNTEESLHVCTLLNFRNDFLILINKSLLCNNVSIEIVGSISVILLDSLKLLGSSEVEFIHLNRIATIGLSYYYLIICILFSSLSTEAEIRRFSINGMQTILTYVLLRIDEHPTLSVLGCFTIAFEISTVNIPGTPVTTRIRTCIITSCQCIEEWVGLIHGTEDDVSVAVSISITTPLGSLHLYFFLFTCLWIYLLLCIIQGNTINQVAIESVTPLVNSITTQEDV